MRVAPENIFPGARIRLGEKIFYVIKVNSKSFYASKLTYLNYIEKYNSRAKGVTFTAFCKANDIKSYKYTESFEIEENEFSRKLIAEQNTNSSYKLEKFENGKTYILTAREIYGDNELVSFECLIYNEGEDENPENYVAKATINAFQPKDAEKYIKELG